MKNIDFIKKFVDAFNTIFSTPKLPAMVYSAERQAPLAAIRLRPMAFISGTDVPFEVQTSSQNILWTYDDISEKLEKFKDSMKSEFSKTFPTGMFHMGWKEPTINNNFWEINILLRFWEV